MAKVVRHLRSKFGKRKDQLPKGLEFLDGVKFYAITEHIKNGRKEKRIEILPRNLRVVLDIKNSNEELEAQVRELKKELSTLQSDFEELQKIHSLLASNYDQLVENVSSDINKCNISERSPKNYFGVAEERGFSVKGLALQGGLPSLGKKR